MSTIRDVARLAGVSISTVSLTFAGGARVRDETARRVWAAAKRLGYVPNPLAQSLKRGHSRMIGVVVGDISNPFFGRLLKEVERLSLEHGHLVIVSDSDADAARELDILGQLAAQRVAGVILTPHGHGEDYVRQLREIRVPIVTVDHHVAGAGFDFVASDNRLASAMLTEHVVRYGHRRVAQIAGKAGLWTAEERKRGFRETLGSAGIAVDESLIVDGDYRDVVAYEQTMRLLTRTDRPTAIVAANNVMALGALQAMNELGFRCPDDVSLVSVDDVPWSGVVRPKITMVIQNIEQMARIATGYLTDRMSARGGAGPEPRTTILVPRLIVGESCAAPAA